MPTLIDVDNIIRKYDQDLPKKFPYLRNLAKCTTLNLKCPVTEKFCYKVAIFFHLNLRQTAMKQRTGIPPMELPGPGSSLLGRLVWKDVSTVIFTG